MKYPKGEIVWVHAYDTGNQLLYIISSKPTRDAYYLNVPDGKDGFKRLYKDKNPLKLEEKYRTERGAIHSE